MADDKRRKQDDTAEHAGTANRDDERPEPGSGLERRQARNTDHTGKSQAEPDEATPAPDPASR